MVGGLAPDAVVAEVPAVVGPEGDDGVLPEAEAVLAKVAAGDPQTARHDAWAWLLLSLLRYPQGFVMVLAVGMIAPSLIAKDVLSRAFLLYFSRPLARTEYVLGKLFVVCTFLVLMITAAGGGSHGRLDDGYFPSSVGSDAALNALGDTN